MQLSKTERRIFPRINFKPDKPLNAEILVVRKGDTPVKVHIVNISQAGLCFYFAKKDHAVIKEGIHLVLLKIEGESLLNEIKDVDMVVQWSTHVQALNYELNGCRFLNMLPDYRIQMAEFIDYLIESKIDGAPTA